MFFLKPSQVKRQGLKPHFRITKDGRTILDLTMPRGREARDELIAKAWSRDNEKCGICGKYVCLLEATWDHILPCGLGGATRNDILENIQAAHWQCNGAKQSRRDFHIVP